LIAVATAAGAEEVDEFSRANCFNNESISYDYFAPAFKGQVISWHYDTQNGNAVHYVGASNPVVCYGQYSNSCSATCTAAMSCRWPLLYQNRMAAIHNVQDGVPLPGLSTRWHTHGYHNHTFGYLYGFFVYYVAETDAVNCILHFDQFY
jgi:hypothetical protein